MRQLGEKKSIKGRSALCVGGLSANIHVSSNAKSPCLYLAVLRKFLGDFWPF